MLSHIDSDTTTLCSHQKYVNKYNDLIIHKIFHANESFDVMMETNVMGVEHVENWLHDSKFDHIRYVAIGARVMITKNINISKGVVNGTFTIVTSITFNNDKIITIIFIKIISTNRKIMLKRQTLQHKYTSKTYNYKKSFSIVLTYAITSHKAQGATIKSKVIIDIKNSFALGFTYVMLSKVTKNSNPLICQTLIFTKILIYLSKLGIKYFILILILIFIYFWNLNE